MAKTSVIITVYNRRHLLERALLALSTQVHLVDELVVSDDGSQEDVFGAVKEFAAAHPLKVTWITQADKGFRLAKVRNNAIREASGDFVIFMDQDVVYTPGFLECFLKHQSPDRFLVAYAIRLSQDQSRRLTDDMVLRGDFSAVVEPPQMRKVRSQWFKDGLEYLLKRYARRPGYRPKLRGLAFGLHRDTLERVDGFDENYQGWGGEDDDLGRRLYRAGVIGRNPFLSEYPVHLYHEPFHSDGIRPNEEYYGRRIKEIQAGSFRAVRGLSNPLPDDSVTVERLR